MAASLLSPSLRRFLFLMEPSTHLSIFSLLCLFLLFSLSIFLYRKKKKNPTKPISSHLSIFPFSISPPLKRPHQAPSKQLFVQILTSPHSPKWAAPDGASSDAVDRSEENRPPANGSEPDLDADAAEDFDNGGRELKGKRKKKRGKKKRQNPRAEDDSGREEDEGQRENHAAVAARKPTLECLYPFTSSSSVTQRKIKLHYDELVKSNEAKALTMAQVWLGWRNPFRFWVPFVLPYCFGERAKLGRMNLKDWQSVPLGLFGIDFVIRLMHAFIFF